MSRRRARSVRLLSVGVPAVFALLSLHGCVGVVPYQPGRATIDCLEGGGEWPSDAFERVQAVLVRDYPLLEWADPDRFAWQSAWCARSYLDTAAQSRVTLWREGDEMVAVIEVRYLQRAVLGVPDWSEPRGQRHWERDLLDAVEAALEAS